MKLTVGPMICLIKQHFCYMDNKPFSALDKLQVKYHQSVLYSIRYIAENEKVQKQQQKS